MTIGLTGGIGSGKSTVVKLFELLGCVIFKSDDTAKQLYFDPEIKKRVIELLGDKAYLNEKQIDRNYIGNKIFSDPTLLEKLNAIIHPEVNSQFKIFESKNKGKILLIESALLFEADINKQVEKVITVISPDELRIERVMKRDGLDRNEVISKMKTQLSQEEKARRSDFIIRNNEEELMIPQVLEIYQQLNKHIN
ncbi:MAG TPA: dephospho-CoA kinase [Bacteroidia bacterium]|jgi:dephospho-CoA kinase|nr:dephospho-CoA kinase [Bacteroidia bacterium]